jgi:hypothetical protein
MLNVFVDFFPLQFSRYVAIENHRTLMQMPLSLKPALKFVFLSFLGLGPLFLWLVLGHYT